MMAVSLPITCAATWRTTSGMTGLTLPGMIDEPFWSSGSAISDSPQRGPDPIRARSLAIFVSDTATTLSAPESSTRESRLAWASNGSAGPSTGTLVASVSRARTPAAKSGWVFRPVPTAVPPSGICATRGRASATRSRPEPDLRGVAAELLAQRDRHGVHEVRAAGLDEVGELVGLGRQRAGQALEGGQQLVAGLGHGRQVDRGGKTSLDDCPMFTWSFGWTPSPASAAITSFAFVFAEVPEPVWNTSIGNWSSCRPSAISSPAAAMRSAISSSSSPSSALVRAAAALMRPSQWMTDAGTCSPEIWKFSTAFDVSLPQS